MGIYMKRMRTFLLYLLGILGFMLLSYVLEDALIGNMYKTMQGSTTKSDAIATDIQAEVTDASASNVNGYINFKLRNNSDEIADGDFVKIDLYDEQGLLSATEYVEIKDLGANENKDYSVKFKGTEISDYKLSIIPKSEVPDLSNKVNILGFDVDLSNVFGFDLSNVSVFGTKLKDIFRLDKAKGAIANAWGWSVNLAKSVPWWGYAIGAGVVLWYLPSGYIFGILP